MDEKFSSRARAEVQKAKPKVSNKTFYWYILKSIFFGSRLQIGIIDQQDSTLATGRRSYADTSSSSSSPTTLNITAVTGISVDLGRRVEKREKQPPYLIKRKLKDNQTFTLNN